MKQCLITFRSVTPAQQGERALRTAGFSCVLQRTPRILEERGCGYCLRLQCGQIPQALALLESRQIPCRKVYSYGPGQTPEELHL